MIFNNAFQFLLAVSVMASSVEARGLKKKVKEGTIFDTVVPGVEATDTDTDEPAAAELLYTPNDKYVDEICVNYCDEYFNKYCVSANYFLNGYKRRNLISTEEENPVRGSDLTKGLQKCQETCMKWPRPVDPFTYSNIADDADYMDFGQGFNSNLGGDTFWCRERHMTMVGVFEDYGDFQGGFQSAAAFHCSFTAESGSGICADAKIDGVTPYEALRDGQGSRRHFGYCDIAGDGKIADCTNMNTIDDANLDVVLSMMPDTIEILFLSGIEGITTFGEDIFQNLPGYEYLKAIYANQCNIDVIHENALRGLKNLEIFNIDENNDLGTSNGIPGEIFKDTPKLKQFSMFDHGMTGAVPAVFHNTPDIEVITMYCLADRNKFTEFPTDVFKGLKKLEMISFVFCDFFDGGIPGDTFDDLESLKYFDFFENPRMTDLPNRWFNCKNCGGSKMGKNLIRLLMWGTGLSDGDIGDKVFEKLENLEAAWFYNTGVTTFDYELLKNNKKLNHFSLGSPIAP